MDLVNEIELDNDIESWIASSLQKLLHVMDVIFPLVALFIEFQNIFQIKI